MGLVRVTPAGLESFATLESVLTGAEETIRGDALMELAIAWENSPAETVPSLNATKIAQITGNALMALANAITNTLENIASTRSAFRLASMGNAI